jgi:hypothetical protein
MMERIIEIIRANLLLILLALLLLVAILGGCGERDGCNPRDSVYRAGDGVFNTCE